MKISGALLAVLLIAVGAATVTIGYAISLAVTPIVAIEYNGEFSTDAQLATEGPWGTSFAETYDCNVTDDILGNPAFTGCVYETSTRLTTQNFTKLVFPFQIEIDDGPIQGGEIDGDLQNTGTLQAKDDIYIDKVEIWTHADEPRRVSDLTNYIEDAGQSIDATFGTLQAEEYVLLVELQTKAILPEGADGDDILKLTIDLVTEGEADKAYVLLENG